VTVFAALGNFTSLVRARRQGRQCISCFLSFAADLLNSSAQQKGSCSRWEVRASLLIPLMMRD
jgi:hypothetical protein